jgi:hypothetical protein
MEAVDYLLKECDAGEYCHLNDEWNRTEYENRTDVIEDLVEAIHWATDGNREMIHKKLGNTKIVSNWSDGRDEIEGFIKKYDVENKGRHYSIYPDKNKESSPTNDNSDDRDKNTTEQNLKRKKSRSEWEKRTMKGNQILNSSR